LGGYINQSRCCAGEFVFVADIFFFGMVDNFLFKAGRRFVCPSIISPRFRSAAQAGRERYL